MSPSRQHLSQAVLDSGIVGGCGVSGVGRRQRSQQVRAGGVTTPTAGWARAGSDSADAPALRELRGDELAAADGATQDYHALLGRWDGPVPCPAGCSGSQLLEKSRWLLPCAVPRACFAQMHLDVGRGTPPVRWQTGLLCARGAL